MIHILDLCTHWRLRRAAGGPWLEASVPGSVQTDLMAHGLLADPYYGENEAEAQWVGREDWEYELVFEPPEGLISRRRVELVLEGLDCHASLWLNGSGILEADNAYRAWRINLEGLLVPGPNTLRILFHSVYKKALPLHQSAQYSLEAPNDREDPRISPYVRKPPFHFGWDWGPRLLSMGIWKPLRLEAYDALRLERPWLGGFEMDGQDAMCHFFVEAESLIESELELRASARLLGAEGGETELSWRRIGISRGRNRLDFTLRIPQAQLWWSRGLGRQNLYELSLGAYKGGEELDSTTRTFGLRTLRLLRQDDGAGQGFCFELNGQRIFAKGACWIPADCFPHRVGKDRYDDLLCKAAQANMNFLRVWGGGIYESDYFYQKCAELGILVWQDFMFACSMYPGDRDFLSSVEAEALDAVRRLRGQCALALYCGNNEILAAWNEWGWRSKLTPSQAKSHEADYDALFNRLLPSVVEREDPSTAYIPSSPLASLGSPPRPREDTEAREAALDPMTLLGRGQGDIHYWGVWHSDHDFARYDDQVGRFMSEYGFQAHLEPSSLRRFIPADQAYPMSQAMVQHQKCWKDGNRGYGEEKILDCLATGLWRPTGLAELLYLSQLQQAEGLKLAMESHRRHKQDWFCSGSLFWQLNDCWPVTSWSSIDYYGRRKALHYYAARAFAPYLASFRKGEAGLELWLVSDLPRPSGDICLLCEYYPLDSDRPQLLRKLRLGLGPDQSMRLRDAPLEAALNGVAGKEGIIRARLLSASAEILADNWHYSGRLGDIGLMDPGLGIGIDWKGKSFECELSCNRPCLGLRLVAANDEALELDDNWLSLFPGDTIKLRGSLADAQAPVDIRPESLYDWQRAACRARE